MYALRIVLAISSGEPAPSLIPLTVSTFSRQACTHCGSPSHRSHEIGMRVSGWKVIALPGQASWHSVQSAPSVVRRHLVSSNTIVLVSGLMEIAFSGQAGRQGV